MKTLDNLDIGKKEKRSKILKYSDSENEENDNEELPITHKKEKSIPPVVIQPVIKEKKPRSEKQLEAFKRTQEKRKENIALKKEQKEIEASKILLKHKITEKPKIKPQKYESDSEEEEEKVIIVEKRKKTKN
jgi:hypothetical protein